MNELQSFSSNDLSGRFVNLIPTGVFSSEMYSPISQKYLSWTFLKNDSSIYVLAQRFNAFFKSYGQLLFYANFFVKLWFWACGDTMHTYFGKQYLSFHIYVISLGSFTPRPQNTLNIFLTFIGELYQSWAKRYHIADALFPYKQV